jgi:MFS family permease
VFQPPVVQAFGAGWARYSLVVSLLTLGTLAFLLLGGVLGDIFGRRRLLLGGLAALIVANLLAAISPVPSWVIATRLLAGAAGALIVPLSLTMLYVAFSNDVPARTVAIAIYVIVASTARMVAGMLGQLMYLLWDWRATLVVPTALALLGWLLIWRISEESRVPETHRFDVVGHAAWALTVFGVLFGLLVSQVAGPYAAVSRVSALTTVVCGIGVLIWWDYRSPDSLLGQSKIPRWALVVLIVYGVCLQIGFVGLIGLVRNVLIAVYDYSVVWAAIGLTPLVVGMLAMTLWGVSRLVSVRPHLIMGGGWRCCSPLRVPPTLRPAPPGPRFFLA